MIFFSYHSLESNSIHIPLETKTKRSQETRTGKAEVQGNFMSKNAATNKILVSLTTNPTVIKLLTLFDILSELHSMIYQF